MTKDQLIELLKFFSGRQSEWLDLWLKAASIFTTIISVVIGGTVVGVFTYNSNPYFVLTALGPLLVFLLSLYGKKACGRLYQRFLEDTTITSKIEEQLGLHDENGRPNAKTFPNDKSYVPQRWLDARNKYNDSATFIEEHLEKGVNMYIILTFNVGILLGIAGFAFILILWLKTICAHAS